LPIKANVLRVWQRCERANIYGPSAKTEDIELKELADADARFNVEAAV